MNMKIRFLESEYIVGGVETTAQSASKTGNQIAVGGTHVKWGQRISVKDSFGCNKKMENNFVLLRMNESGADWFWVGKLLLLFRVEANRSGIETEEELTFAQ